MLKPKMQEAQLKFLINEIDINMGEAVQKQLYAYYIEGRKIVDIAEEFGLGNQAISRSIRRFDEAVERLQDRGIKLSTIVHYDDANSYEKINDLDIALRDKASQDKEKAKLQKFICEGIKNK